MRTHAKATMVAAVWMLFAGRAGAQPPQAGGTTVPSLGERYVDTAKGLSLADAIARAIEREPTLRAVRAEADATRGLRVQAGLRPNPTVSFERREEAAGTDNQTMAHAEWPLDLFRRSARIAVADTEIEATERSIDKQLRTLVNDVRMRYGQAAAAVRDVAVADELAASARRQFELLRQRVDEGASPPLERDLMEVELRRFESGRLLAVGWADAAIYELKKTLGQPAQEPLLLRDTLETLAPPALADAGVAAGGPPDVRTDYAAAIRERSDVREAEARVRIAQARVERARTEGRFDVSLFGSYMRMDQGFPQIAFDANSRLERVRGVFHYLSAGATVTVPLRNRKQGEIAVVQGERAGAGARLEAVQLAAQNELAAAESLETQARRALAFSEGSVRLARQNVDVLRQTYELGRATVSDVLAEQRRYWAVEREYTETLKAAYDARTALQHARGDR